MFDFFLITCLFQQYFLDENSSAVYLSNIALESSTIVRNVHVPKTKTLFVGCCSSFNKINRFSASKTLVGLRINIFWSFTAYHYKIFSLLSVVLIKFSMNGSIANIIALHSA